MWYPYSKPNGERGIMYTIPVEEMVKIYSTFNDTAPKTFFDCGAANGHILLEAEKMGISVSGVEKDKYYLKTQEQKDLVKQGKLQIMPIEKCAPIKADLAYCNGVLTYMDEVQLALTLSKFGNVNTLIVSHDTFDDILDAKTNDYHIPYQKNQNIKPIIWWIAYFQTNGFEALYDSKRFCFVLFPKKQLVGQHKLKVSKRKPTRKLRTYPKIDLLEEQKRKLKKKQKQR